jgi:hypothetical protein
MIPPIAAVVAGHDPDIAAKIMEAPIETIARPPVKREKKRLTNCTNFFESPPAVMRLPARIKNGIAMRGKELMPLNMVWATMTKGVFMPMTMASTAAKPRLTPIGTPMIISRKKLKNRIEVVLIRFPPSKYPKQA